MTKAPGEIEPPKQISKAEPGSAQGISPIGRGNGNERVRDRATSICEEPRASESRAARTRGRGDTTAYESKAQGEKEMKVKPLIGLVATLCDERVCSVLGQDRWCVSLAAR